MDGRSVSPGARPPDPCYYVPMTCDLFRGPSFVVVFIINWGNTGGQIVVVGNMLGLCGIMDVSNFVFSFEDDYLMLGLEEWVTKGNQVNAYPDWEKKTWNSRSDRKFYLCDEIYGKMPAWRVYFRDVSMILFLIKFSIKYLKKNSKW